MKTNYLKRYCVQTLEVTEDVADRNQEGLTGWRKAQGNRVVEIGWRLPRKEDGGDICLGRSRPNQGRRADDDAMLNGLCRCPSPANGAVAKCDLAEYHYDATVER